MPLNGSREIASDFEFAPNGPVNRCAKGIEVYRRILESNGPNIFSQLKLQEYQLRYRYI